MIQGLKESVPIVVKASPEVTLTGQWLADEVSDCVTSLGQVGFKVRGIVADNHSTNISAFNILQTRFACGCFAIQHLHNSTKTYLFFNNVHLVKNIHKNLLNCKNLYFLLFLFPSMISCLHRLKMATYPGGIFMTYMKRTQSEKLFCEWLQR